MFMDGAWWSEGLVMALMPVAPPLLRADDHLLLRYYAAIMRVVRPVFVRVLLLFTNNSKAFKELLFELPDYSNKQYKNDFSKEERKKLDNNVSSNTFDITLLFILLQRLCGLPSINHENWSTPDTLENNLKRLKNHRNDLAHEDLAFSPDDLQRRLSNIEDLCREVLKEAGQRCKCAVFDDIRVMEKNLEQILTGGIDLWQPYRQALYKLQQEHCNLLIREGRKEIKEFAKKLRILNPFVWLLEDRFAHLDVGHIFTDLYIEGQREIRTQDIFTIPLNSGKYPDVLIMVGPPGIGKTSLTKFCLHDWLSTASICGMDNYDIVLLVELRHVTSENIQDLVCEEILPNTCFQLKREDVLPTLRQVSTLWLLDGYDEATNKTKYLVKEIMKKFQNSQIMITSRPDNAKDLHLLINEVHRSNTVYQLRGLSPTMWKVYATKLFSVSVVDEGIRRDSHQKFIKFLKEKEQDMFEIFRVPLFLVMLVVLWLESPTEVTGATSVTRLYHILINLIVNTMTRRLHLTALGFTESQLRGKINNFLNLLGKIFWENSERLVFVLMNHQVKQIEKLCEISGLPYKECMSPFFRVIVKATTTGTTEEYLSLHRTVQEFLAARAFCNCMITQGCDVLTVAAQWMLKHTENPYQHMAYENEFCNKTTSKTNFVMEKLHEGSDDVYDDYHFVSTSFFSTNCFCRIFLDFYSEINDPGELEREFCRQRFLNMAHGTLLIPFICGYLKMNDALTRPRAEQIIYVAICNQNKIRQFSLWMKLIHETEEDKEFIEELNSQLFSYQWNPSPLELPSVAKLLEFITPESVHVHLCDLDDYSNNKTFIDGLRILARFPIRISLDLQNSMLSNNRRFLICAQICLAVLLDPRASCHLTALGCPLNKKSISVLRQAQHLEDLYVRVDNLEDLQTLAQITNTLQNLENLSVFINFTLLNIHIKMLPTFRLKQHIQRNQNFADLQSTHTVMPGHNTSRKYDVIFLNHHKCTPPKIPSHKLLHRSWKVSRRGKSNYLCEPIITAIPFPTHLQKLKTRGIYESCQRMWNMPSGHCHSRCTSRQYDSHLCSYVCAHRFFTPPSQTKQEWSDFYKSIRYHHVCLKKLRSFYKMMWKIIVQIYTPNRHKYTKYYDSYIKTFCYQMKDQQLRDSIHDVFIDSLEVCELLLYEHRISIQQHRKRLILLREPSNPLSSVQFILTDPSIVEQAAFSSLLYKLCPNPQRIALLNTIDTMPVTRRVRIELLDTMNTMPVTRRVKINIHVSDSAS
ncbi:uncharacterized protein [Cherax quadricarinatus]|uniref:uncharacterized protein n=1 Tax=Cherax quadricarinatus TaxID=27406 RepID=UPI00387EB38A